MRCHEEKEKIERRKNMKKKIINYHQFALKIFLFYSIRPLTPRFLRPTSSGKTGRQIRNIYYEAYLESSEHVTFIKLKKT